MLLAIIVPPTYSRWCDISLRRHYSLGNCPKKIIWQSGLTILLLWDFLDQFPFLHSYNKPMQLGRSNWVSDIHICSILGWLPKIAADEKAKAGSLLGLGVMHDKCSVGCFLLSPHCTRKLICCMHTRACKWSAGRPAGGRKRGDESFCSAQPFSPAAVTALWILSSCHSQLLTKIGWKDKKAIICGQAVQ